MKEIIRKIIESGYSTIGIRHEDRENYKVGDTCRNSYEWNYELDTSTYDTDEPIELDGACAYNTDIDLDWDEEEEIEEKLIAALEKSKCYLGKTLVIGGKVSTYGNDEEEIIIRDAEVLAIIE